MAALQVWRNRLHDPAGALAQYRRALSLGGTLPLPELFAAAGARLLFDPEPMQQLVGLIEQQLEELSSQH
jgi:oligoendopeptidase F